MKKRKQIKIYKGKLLYWLVTILLSPIIAVCYIATLLFMGLLQVSYIPVGLWSKFRWYCIKMDGRHRTVSYKIRKKDVLDAIIPNNQ